MDRFIGTAGWSIASRQAERLPGAGTHLERYGRVLGAVEIDSSFYRPHRRETYARWAASVPEGFRFSVKMPRAVTHRHRLIDCLAPLDEFIAQIAGLGGKLGAILIQLPPSLRFDAPTAARFFATLRERSAAPLALEPRHASWGAAEAEALLQGHGIARVAADPPPFEGADAPAGWPRLAYFRLHGTPRIYYSDYPPERLESIQRQVEAAARTAETVWCIFDNTAQGHALDNALDLAAAFMPLPVR